MNGTLKQPGPVASGSRALLGETVRYSSRFKNNFFTGMESGFEEGSCLRLIDFCITQL